MVASQIAVTWTDTDGHVWDLRDTTSGVWLGPKTKGLITPPVQRHTSEMHNAAGSWWRGQHVQERSVILEIHISSTTVEEWALLHDRWWSGMDTNKTGTLTVQAPGRPARSLTLRPVWDDAHEDDIDPTRYAFVPYACEWVAENPYYQGVTTTVSAMADTIQPHYSTEERPDSLWISSGLGQATISNTGDAEAYATWILTGPINKTVTLTTPAGPITIPNVNLTTGQTLRIETDPVKAGLFDGDGQRLPNTATIFTMSPLPPGDVLVTADVGLSGNAQVRFAAQYWRGW